MADSIKISFRLDPAIHDMLQERVRHGRRLPDILREAIEGYLGLRPTVPDKPSDTMSDMTAKITALTSDVATLQERLEELDAYLQTRAPRVRQRPTVRPTIRPTTQTTGYDAEAAVARMQTLRDQGMSLAQIATTLNQEGVSTRHGGLWHKGTVGYCLQRQRST